MRLSGGVTSTGEQLVMVLRCFAILYGYVLHVSYLVPLAERVVVGYSSVIFSTAHMT